jgi:ribosomal protein S18 acetylase RimI-like enzyme
VPDVQIRAFKESDEDQVLSLWRECGLLRPWNDPRKDIARKLRVQRELFLLAVRDGRVTGSAMFGYEGHRGWVSYFCVAAAERRTGLGRLLMREGELRLAALGCPKVNLQVRADNLAAVGFYRALGYAEDAVVSLGKRLEDETASA